MASNPGQWERSQSVVIRLSQPITRPARFCTQPNRLTLPVRFAPFSFNATDFLGIPMVNVNTVVAFVAGVDSVLRVKGISL